MLKEQRSTSYIIGALVVMVYIFYRSMFIQTTYVLPAVLHDLLEPQPFLPFLSAFTFQYGEQLISVQSLGYFGFLAFFGNKVWLFLTYAVLTYLWFIGLSGKMRDKVLPAVLTWLLVVSYSAADEFHQLFLSPQFSLKEDVFLTSISISMTVILSWILLSGRKVRK